MLKRIGSIEQVRTIGKDHGPAACYIVHVEFADAIKFVVRVVMDVKSQIRNPGVSHGLAEHRDAVRQPARIEFIVMFKLVDEIGIAQLQAADITVSQAPRGIERDVASRYALLQCDIEVLEPNLKRGRVAEYANVLK